MPTTKPPYPAVVKSKVDHDRATKVATNWLRGLSIGR